jgi:GDSL-like Lipase/Acylhydrolase family
MLPTLPRKTSLTIGAFIAIAACLPNGLRPAQALSTFRISLPAIATLPVPPALVVVTPAAPSLTTTKPAVPTSPNLTVPPGSLGTFFDSLRRTEAKEPGAVTRILHYGDSPTTADSITSDVRRILQERFGDAGHGFVLIAKPWAWYGHHGIDLEARGWQIQPASLGRAPDGIHGLGGVSFIGGKDASSWVTLPDTDYSRGVVYYLAQPEGGEFYVRGEDGKRDSNDTSRIIDIHTATPDGTARAPAFAEFAIPPNTKTLELGVAGGKVRLFGYRFDKNQPGVQYSSLGINGAQVQMIDRFFEPKQWTAALRHEDPALVVLNYGTNESLYSSYVSKEYPNELRKAIATVRAALPQASILLMGPMDRGVMGAGSDISTPEALTSLIEVQKKVAEETGCAFFNTFEAMGGAGTMGRWYHAQPRLVSADFIHPMPAGAAIVGELFANALIQSYAAHQ